MALMHAFRRTPGPVLLLLLALVCWQPGMAAAGEADEPDLRSVAVNVHRSPVQPWPGYGIYLGEGLVITAAHVAGHGLLTRPKVFVAGQDLPTSIVKEGSYPDMDLTILKIDGEIPPQLAGRQTPLCGTALHPDDPVIVATPEALTTSVIASPTVLPADLRAKYGSLIRDVYTTGNSGSGVFDAKTKCLLGIMSAKIEGTIVEVVNGQKRNQTVGIAKIFVPSSTIRDFMSGLPKG